MPSRGAPLRFLGALTAFVLLGRMTADASTLTIRWVLLPEYKSTELVEDFARRLSKETAGKWNVEVLSFREYSTRFNGGRPVVSQMVLKALLSNEVQMVLAPTSLASVYASELSVLDMPFLFSDYGHAERVLDGPFGKSLGESLPRTSGIRGLAYSTFGFGLFAMRVREPRRPGEFRALRVTLDRGIRADILARSLGIEPIRGPSEAFVPLAEADVSDGAETVFTKFVELQDDKQAKIIINTRHYLSTSIVLINNRFFEGLPIEVRACIERASKEAARVDRARTIEREQQARLEAKRRGVKILDLTAAERGAIEKATMRFEGKGIAVTGSDSIRLIRAAATVER